MSTQPILTTTAHHRCKDCDTTTSTQWYAAPGRQWTCRECFVITAAEIMKEVEAKRAKHNNAKN